MQVMTLGHDKDNTMGEINVRNNNLEITIEGKSDDFYCQDLYMKAVTTLIEEASTEDWDAPESLYTLALSSIARAYLRDCDFPLDTKGISAYEVIGIILNDFKSDSELNKSILESDLYDDE
jgi:hypothetical protein